MSDTDGYGLRIARTYRDFRHEVNVLTDSLFRILDGVNSSHRHLIGHRSWSMPQYPRLRMLPMLIGEGSPQDRTAPGGPIEQFAYRAWITEVYALWESKIRTQFRNAANEENITRAILPEQNVYGDLGYIRNDLLHKSAIAGRSATKCTTLRWFERGQKMVLNSGHVLDFLNQAVLLTKDPICRLPGEEFLQHGSLWIPWSYPAGTVEGFTPNLVSLRAFINHDREDYRSRFGVSVAFADGIFGNAFFESDRMADMDDQRWLKIQISEAGGIDIPGFDALPAVPLANLYRHIRKGESGESQSTSPYSPQFKFRNPSG